MENTTELFVNTTSVLSRSNTASSGSGLTPTFYISLFLIYIPGIVTNLICIKVLLFETRKSKLPTNSLLLILCSVDFVAVCLSCFWHTSSRLGMQMTYNLCAVKSFLHPIMPLLTGAISLLMAVDRVMAFCKPFYYRVHVSKKLWFALTLTITVILSGICILPHLGLGSLWTAIYRRGKISYRCSVFTYQQDPDKKIFHVIYTFTGLLLVAGIIVCNTVVAVAVLLLRSRTIDAQKSRSNQSAVSNRTTEIRFALIVAMLAAVFVTCWLPYNVWVLYKLLNIPMKYEIVKNIHMLGGFNYSTDPFVYLIISKSNRNILCCRKTPVKKGSMSERSTVITGSTISD